MSTGSTSSGHAAHADHAHHFASANHQYSAAKQGIWLFMATEIMMFGGLFVAYIIFRNLYPEMYHEGASHLNWKMGATNTIVLITSSLSMALSIHYLQTGKKNAAAMNLAVTIVCACIFMVIKYFEYMEKIHHGLLPGNFFHYAEAESPNLAIFFGLYFMMTGLHGIHVMAGIFLISWLLFRTLRGDFSQTYYTPVEGVGIFWHIVDLIWIFLFPLFYLIA